MKVAVRTTERVIGCKRALLAGLLCLLSDVVFAQPQISSSMADQHAKSVTQVVLGILSYARWPVEPAQLRLCVVGPSDHTDDLVKVTSQGTGRPVTVQQLPADNTSIATQCDAVYIGKLTGEERSRLFDSLTGYPVLSISESDDQCTASSLFCLRVSDDPVSFEVNLDSVARSGVRIHPSVLQLSRRKPAAP